MPFDNKPEQPTLAWLSNVLRHPEMWPPGFEWNFCDCGRCAMGMLWELMHGERAPEAGWRVGGIVERWFVSQVPEVRGDQQFGRWNDGPFQVFCTFSPYGGDRTFSPYGGDRTFSPYGGDRRVEPITPAEVADAIDAYLATQEVTHAA